MNLHQPSASMPFPRCIAHLTIAGAVAAVALGAFLAAPTVASAQSLCAPPVQNPVACENSKTGADPGTWRVEASGDPTIQGFATQMSVTPGQAISFKIKSATPNYKIRIFRLGYYGGRGARLIDGPLSPTGTSVQPACRQFPDSGLIDCGNWAVSRSWTVPSDAVSGVYIAHLKRDDGGVDGDTGESQIVFVVRNDASASDVVVQTSDQTWQAYNTYGGNSLYICDAFCPPGNPRGYKAAFKVSYNRPLRTETDSEGSALFRGSEYSMIRFLEQNGYDVSYISGVDAHRRGQLVANHDLFISSGHDEYWSGQQRTYVEAARDSGTDLAFFSGNLMFWKTRFEPSSDGSATPDRTLTSYKDTHFDAPADPVEWTGTWRDRRFTGTDEFEPENSVTGLSFLVNAGTTDITVPAEHGKLRMWRNTAAATLPADQSLRLAPETLGYEWDVDADNGFRPTGLFHMSSTTASGLDIFTDYGTTIRSNGTATHNMVMYRAPSGARVFNSGTVQWAWGLSEWNGTGSPVDRNMQQATVNLFADMGVQPATRLSTLVAATASTDTAAPTSTINAPPASVADGTKITISGTATDAGGGRVAGVEVSADGGETWHPATGTASWTYSWTAHGNPQATIKSRAVDDSANIETPGAGRQVGVTCPCSIWGSSVTPDVPDAGDASAIEVGVKFRTSSYGEITGVRFFKAAANTGTHSGSLWTADGQRLAQATFTNETASGWQSVTFAQPVEVVPGTTYVASYHAPNGRYAASSDYFYQQPSPGPNGGAVTSGPPLSAVRNQGGATNGVFSYGSSSSFPVSSYNAGNYWVDVSFRPIAAPGAVTGATATSGGRTSANVSWTAPASGGTVASYRVTPYVGTTALAPKIVSGSPPDTRTTVSGLTTGTTYTFTVQAVNPRGSGPVSAPTGPVTPSAPVAPSAPTAVAAEPASQSARVTWGTPEGDGDSPVSGYTITPVVGGEAQTPVQVDASARSTTITGLVNGSAYTFRVAARNAVGTGAAATTAAVTPQATLLDFKVPATADSGDPDPVELGVKFKADFDGEITGVRFYKAAANTGTHTGNLWSASGAPLASATFRNESASGWQSVTFDEPVDVTAGTTYVASYHTQTGHYAVELNGLTSGLDNPPLHAIANSTSANGVFAYSASSTFPNGSYRASNYYVDVLYAMPRPGQITGVTATPGRRSATVSWAAPAAGAAVTSYRITPYIGSTAQPARTVAGGTSTTSARVDGLTAGTAYTFTVQAANANGAGPASAPSAPVTPTAAIVPAAPTDVAARPASGSALVTWGEPAGDTGSALTGYTITPYAGAEAQTPTQVDPSKTSAVVSGLENGTSYTFRVTATNDVGTGPASAASAAVTPRLTIFDFATPATVDGGDGSQIELGVKFQADVNGSVMGVRFYKAEANVGPHRGSLWSAGGQRLADAVFTGESASGWQTVTFSQPVDITAGTTYTASYHTASGRYSVSGSGLQSAAVNGPLRALSDLTTQNGVYAYGESRFPTSGFNAANYWVDVLFEAAPKPAQVTGVTATAGRASAQVSWTVPSGGGAPTSYEVTPYIGSTAQASRTVSGTPLATTTTFDDLTPGTAYTFRVRARNANGDGPLSAPSAAVTPTAPAVPAVPTDVSARPATQRAEVSWSSVAGDAAPTGFTVTPYVGATAQTPVQVSGGSVTRTVVTGLANGTSYTFRVAARNAAGTSAQSEPSSAVTPRATIFDFGTPALVDAGDPSSVELGVKFNSDSAGRVFGIRFYKAAANTGTHVGSLWSTGGDRLGQVTFTGETASGWQTAYFDQPVDITPGTTYVASYFAPNGRYSATGSGFAAAVHNAPLHALSNAADSNGVYRYTGSSAFPSQTYGASNYWVDVVFAAGS